jgi:hypothetical protein
LADQLSVASRVISYRLAVIGLGKSGEPGAPGPSDAPGRTQIGTLYKLIVVFVATNPYPLDGFAQQLSDCTMMSAYPNRETVAGAAFELFEIE